MKKAMCILTALLLTILILAVLPSSRLVLPASASGMGNESGTPSDEVPNADPAMGTEEGEGSVESVPENNDQSTPADDSAEDINVSETSGEAGVAVGETIETIEKPSTKAPVSEEKSFRFELSREFFIVVSVALLLAVVILAIALSRSRTDFRQLQDRITELENRPAPPVIPVSGPEMVTRTSRQPPIKEPSVKTAPSFLLEGISGYFAGQIMPVKSQTGIGRDAACDIRYPSEAGSISKVHCALIPAKDGVNLVDLGSTCGTFLGSGERLKPHHNYKLTHGDCFFLTNPDQSFRIQ